MVYCREAINRVAEAAGLKSAGKRKKVENAGFLLECHNKPFLFVKMTKVLVIKTAFTS